MKTPLDYMLDERAALPSVCDRHSPMHIPICPPACLEEGASGIGNDMSCCGAGYAPQGYAPRPAAPAPGVPYGAPPSGSPGQYAPPQAQPGYLQQGPPDPHSSTYPPGGGYMGYPPPGVPPAQAGYGYAPPGAAGYLGYTPPPGQGPPPGVQGYPQYPPPGGQYPGGGPPGMHPGGHPVGQGPPNSAGAYGQQQQQAQAQAEERAEQQRKRRFQEFKEGGSGPSQVWVIPHLARLGSQEKGTFLKLTFCACDNRLWQVANVWSPVNLETLSLRV
jgi:hypothetical protein